MNDPGLLNLFNPLYTQFQNLERLTQSPPLLAHYTSISVIEGILQSNEIWFSNPLFMNDLQEMRFGLNEGSRLFANAELLKHAGGTDHRANLLQHAFSHYFQSFDDHGAFDTYIFCLTEHDPLDNDGLLSMWRGYGQHGNGAALVFDTGKVTLVPTSPLIISDMKYASDKDRIGQMEAILRKWAEICAASELADDKLYLASHAAFSAIKMYALTTKHRGFSEEKEWRVIYYPDRDRSGALKKFLGYHIGVRGVEPKLKFRVGHLSEVSAPDLALDRIVDRIILGPSVSSPLARRSVERMLDNIGKSHFKERLCTSGIPLRSYSGGSF